MNKEQRKELKRLAAEATPGPWVAAGPSFGGAMPVYCNEVCVDREGDDDDTYSVFVAPIGMDKEASSDMEYIAAANPKAITALLSALEAAEAECERLRSAIAQPAGEAQRDCGEALHHPPAGLAACAPQDDRSLDAGAGRGGVHPAGATKVGSCEIVVHNTKRLRYDLC